MKIRFNKIDKLIFLGGSFLMPGFVEYALKNFSFNIIVFSAARHLNEKLGSLTLRESLEKLGISYCESEDINKDKNLKRKITRNTLGIALGAAWIFEKKTVALFAKNHLLDFMNIDLPRYRGGAHHTWRILHQNRRGCLNFQIIRGGLETFHKGEIVKRKEFKYPANLKKPIDFINFQAKKEVGFLEEFLYEVKGGKSFKLASLNECKSSRFPFLSTKMNGMINWSWPAKDIYLFICAFDEPYIGAATYFNNRKVFLKESFLLKAEESYHPFTSGIVARKDNGGVFIAAVGHLLQIKKVFDERGKNITDLIKAGARFFTPSSKLDAAMSFKAVYDAKGLKKKI